MLFILAKSLMVHNTCINFFLLVLVYLDSFYRKFVLNMTHLLCQRWDMCAFFISFDIYLHFAYDFAVNEIIYDINITFVYKRKKHFLVSVIKVKVGLFKKKKFNKTFL